jgi:penicillin-binding protein 1A
MRTVAWFAVGLPVIVLCGLFSGAAGVLLGAYLCFSSDLPSIPDLRAYRPKTVSTFYAEDRTVIGIFFREKRFPVQTKDLPPHVINAFLAAEDARFFSHSGLDWYGVLRAALKNIQQGSFAQGGSTITQQVTRNFILSKEKKISRKIREAILAIRLEKTLSKNEILGLYLNEIYLGKGAYGIEAAAGAFFGKPARDLTIAEAALIAGMVANPSKYSQQQNLDQAMRRREFVLGSMLKNGFVNENQYRTSMMETPNFRENLPNPFSRVPYFTEAVRQYILAKYGENRLYNDGLQVWTTCDMGFQQTASEALLKGARAWEKRQGRASGTVRRLKQNEAKAFLAGSVPESVNVGDVVQALIIADNTPKKSKDKKNTSSSHDCTLALPGASNFRMELTSDIPYKPNDVIELAVAEKEGSHLSLEQRALPAVQGAVVCIENASGYVRAVVGGLSYERSTFNRALQARRQPGSAFKPVVYSTALELNHYTPSSMIVDEPIAVVIDPREPEWSPMNSDGGFLGPITFRQALANSRNVAAVKLLMDTGIPQTIDMAKRMGIASPLGQNLSLGLGSSEVTPLELTSAYTVFPNLGMRIVPVLVKKVVDRFGRVLEDNTKDTVDRYAASWSLKPASGVYSTRSDQGIGGRGDSWEKIGNTAQGETPIGAEIDQVMSGTLAGDKPHRPKPERVTSPQTAYLMSSMLRETCVSGTAASVNRLKRRDLAGKTGTTDDCSDAWFVGFNGKYTVGVWMGFDVKASLGRQEYGNVAALPIWMDFMKSVLSNEPEGEYPVPPGIVFSSPVRFAGGKPAYALLEAGPELSPDFEVNPICRLDMESEEIYRAQSMGGGFNFGSPYAGVPYGQGMMAPSVYQSGTVRVLSPSGENLGRAFYSYDEKGKMNLLRDQYQPDYYGRHDLPSSGGESGDVSAYRGYPYQRMMQQRDMPYSGGGWIR